jgi:hypothetical protein
MELYRKLQPPKKFLELLRLEMRMIADKRKGVAARDIKRLNTAIVDLENKEIKLLDEMLAGKLERSIYERMQKKYTDQKDQDQARLSQLQVDYANPLDFLDKCIVVANSLLYMHNHFNFEHRKNLLRAVFERIEVEDKNIVSIKLTPPFSILLGEDIRSQSDDGPTEGTIQDVFEQIFRCGHLPTFAEVRRLVGMLSAKVDSCCGLSGLIL